MTPSETPAEQASLGLAGRIAEAFVNSKLTPLLIIVSVLLGLFAVIALPREEEPQIKVPMIDVMVSMPGASAKEIEERATRPMEHLLWEIPVSNTSTRPRNPARRSSLCASSSVRTSKKASSFSTKNSAPISTASRPVWECRS